MLTATGKVYTLSDNIGMTGKSVINEEVLRDAIKSQTVPLVKAFESMNDPENVIGHADLEIRDDSLWANVTFNQQSEKEYWDAFCNGYSPKLGFYATKAAVDPKVGEVKSMEIRSICLNDTCLGGNLEDIKKE